ATGRRLRASEDYRLSAAAVTFSPDGKTLAGGGAEAIYLWDAVAGKELRRIDGALNECEALVFSPDGRMLASAGKEGVIHLWETSSGKERGRLAGHQDRVTCLAFTPDGRTFLSGSADSTVLVWDPLPRPGKKAEVTLTAKQLEESWAELAGDDAGRAFQAI